ncbi:MAG: arginine N-succinyltransferase [Pirellulaceae bacterium]
MVIVRAVQLEDLDDLWRLIEQATYGLTTLQISREQLSERVELSNFAFTRKTEKPTGEPYVFVMEDVAARALVGLSCIFSKTGGYEPFYSYRRVVESHYCEVLNKTQEVESLHLEKIHDGPTEIGSLFLLPKYRGQGRGRLLSLSRFTFMAAHPKRFADHVIAEMRGVMSEDGACPFWEAIGRHFFDIDFPQADTLSTINKRFIEDLMPRYPIYTSMLPESARVILGDVHPNTRPALAMLEAEGFAKINLIDIFDGGPVVQCATSQIHAVQRTRLCHVAQIAEHLSGETMILASIKGGFRAAIGSMELAGESQVTIAAEIASQLRLEPGDPLLVTALYPPR